MKIKMEFKTNYARFLNEWLPERQSTGIDFEAWLIREVSKARGEKNKNNLIDGFITCGNCGSVIDHNRGK